MKHRLLFEALVVLALSLPTVLPVLSPGYFPMHDDTQVGRVVAMGKALREGQFPVRWISDLGYGYGYPIFNFYGPLPYYFGGLLFAMGVAGVTATKAMMAVGMVLLALTIFLFLRQFTSLIPALAGSVLYVYAPYHAVELYVRGAVGELWTLAFYPLLAWGLLGKNTLLGSIGLAGVILSHTLLGYAAVIIVGFGLTIYWIFRFLTKRFDLSFIIYHLSLIIFALGLSAFFWLPAIAEMKFTDVAGQISATANFRDHFVCLGELWDGTWGFGGSAAGCIDGMSFKLGKIQILLSVLALLFLMRSKLSAATRRLGLFGLIVSLASIVLLLPISLRVWEVVPQFFFIQYPWRFLGPASFGMALMGSIVFVVVKKRLISLFIIALAIVVNGKLFSPQYIMDRPAATYETQEELRWRVSLISDEYLPPGFRKPKSQKELPQGDLVDSGTSFSFYMTSVFLGEVTINKAYFPGWRYWVNGVEAAPRVSEGLPIVTVQKGTNAVVGKLTNTPVRTFGNIVSLVSLLLVGRILWVKNRR